MTPASPIKAMTALDWLLLLGLSLLWGGSYVFMKIAVGTIPPLTIVFCRVLIAATVLGMVLLVSGIGVPKGRAAWSAFIGMGLLNNVVPYSLILFGQQSISAGLASILNATTPLFTILVAHVFTSDEKLTRWKMIGIGLGLGGVIILIGPEVLAHLGHSVIAEVACLGGALSYAFANSFGRRFARLGIKPLQTAFGQVACSTIISLPIALFIDRPWTLTPPTWPPILAVLALGVFSTALAYVIFFRILSRSGATAIALVTLMIPPSAITMGAVILGEHLTMTDVAGMALIGFGLLTVNQRRHAPLVVAKAV